MKGGVWPSLPANASDKKDSFSTGASIDPAHQKNPKNYLVHQPPPSATVPLPADAAADQQRGVISGSSAVVAVAVVAAVTAVAVTARWQRGGGSGSMAAAAAARQWHGG